MKRCLPVLILLFVIRPFFLTGAVVSEQPSPEAPEALLEEIAMLKEKYRNTAMPYESPDRAVFKRIGRAARTSEALIQELIELTSIQAGHPGTSERISAFGLSPAAGQLWSLGDIAKPHIEARLTGDDLTPLQRKILGEVLTRWERRAESLRVTEEYFKVLRAEEARQAAEIEAAATETMKRSDGENPDEANPNGKLVWTMLFAAGALGLAWIGVRWRCCIRKRTGTTAEA